MTVRADRALAVLALRAAGLSLRRIAEKVGIARETVVRILRHEGPHAGLPAEVSPSEADYLPEPVRCHGCGALLTQQPCVACGLPPFAPAEAAVDMTEEELGELLGVDLHGGERARYEAVRARKQAGGETPVRPSDRPPAEARFADALLSRILEGGDGPRKNPAT